MLACIHALNRAGITYKLFHVLQGHFPVLPAPSILPKIDVREILNEVLLLALELGHEVSNFFYTQASEQQTIV